MFKGLSIEYQRPLVNLKGFVLEYIENVYVNAIDQNGNPMEGVLVELLQNDIVYKSDYTLPNGSYDTFEDGPKTFVVRVTYKTQVQSFNINLAGATSKASVTAVFEVQQGFVMYLYRN
jgi:hypothetical protein